MEAVESIVQSCEEEPKMVLNRNISNRHIERLEAELLNYPQVDCPLEHTFAPGVYLRQITMPAGTFVMGHEHTTTHANVVISGRARVLMDGKVTEIVGPCTFISGAGVRKVLYIVEEMKWLTVHPTHSTDLQQLEAELIHKSDAFKLNEEQKKQLTQGVSECHGQQ